MNYRKKLLHWVSIGNIDRQLKLLEIEERQTAGTLSDTDLTDLSIIQIVRSLNGELQTPIGHYVAQNMKHLEGKVNDIIKDLGFSHLSFMATTVISDNTLTTMLNMVFNAADMYKNAKK
jgi:hypothetical protein